jgi:hypothetical protein
LSLVAIVARDLIIATRIEGAAIGAGWDVLRVEEPAAMPDSSTAQLAFVDWGARGPGWGVQLRAWLESAPPGGRPRLVLFGPHADLSAHAAAREAGIGPMIARSKLITDLGTLLT